MEGSRADCLHREHFFECPQREKNGRPFALAQLSLLSLQNVWLRLRETHADSSSYQQPEPARGHFDFEHRPMHFDARPKPISDFLTLQSGWLVGLTWCMCKATNKAWVPFSLLKEEIGIRASSDRPVNQSFFSNNAYRSRTLRKRTRRREMGKDQSFSLSLFWHQTQQYCSYARAVGWGGLSLLWCYTVHAS